MTTARNAAETRQMMTTKHGVPRRPLLDAAAASAICNALQGSLTDLIDLSLLLKQAHWNIVGPSFRSIHLQLDEIVAGVREGSDEIAERMAQIGVAPDGRSGVVANTTRLSPYPEGFVSDAETVTQTVDAMATAIEGLRATRATVAEHDPVTEDLVISVIRPLEKHLWMMQSCEASA